MDYDALTTYLTLLTIRRKGAYRNTLIAAALFFVAAASTLVLGMLDEVTGRSVYLISFLLILLGGGFGMAYVRYEMIGEVMGLVDELIHAGTERAVDDA